MYTREEFEQMRKEAADQMAADKDLKKKAMDVIEGADKHHWIHQTNWLGEPCLQLPQDMFALQEIIFKTRPRTIIEVGMAWGGTTLFLASMLKTIGHRHLGTVIAIDKYMPADLRRRISTKVNEYDLPDVYMLEKDSLDKTIKGYIDNYGNYESNIDVLVILDSNHTQAHVYNELRFYSQFLRTKNYIVVCDTLIEDLKNPSRKRDWGKGNNPRTAIQQFLSENTKFRSDKELESKLLLSCQPDGYLKKVR